MAKDSKSLMAEVQAEMAAERAAIEADPQLMLEIRVWELRVRILPPRWDRPPGWDVPITQYRTKNGYTHNFHMCFTLVKDWDIVYPAGPAHIIIFSTCDGAGQLIQDHEHTEPRKVYAEWNNWEEAPVEICKAWCEMMEEKHGNTP